MFSILLVIIYISFISLGLPDALLGSAWPSMYGALQVPVSYAGIISMIIAGSTIISSLFSDRMIEKSGTGRVTAISVCMTSAALFGFSMSNDFIMLCLWAVPYGLGAGSVDAALNNFVALNYKARHMSWLHCFWGIGATLGPYIMGFCLTRSIGWEGGYRYIAILQIGLTAILILSLPLWKKSNPHSEKEAGLFKHIGIKELLKKSGAKPALLAFFCYSALEATTGLWGSSYLVIEKGLSADTAAKWISLFYLGITLGRFLSGFITMKAGNRNMIRLGQGIVVIGVMALLLPIGDLALGAGFVLLGLGCAPIFPSMLHQTPDNFGKGLSQAIMGIQMACAYAGSTLMPSIAGMLFERAGIKLYPFFLLIFVLLMAGMAECLNKVKSWD